MTAPSLIAFDRADIAPAHDHPKPERLVAGNPLRTTFSHYARGEVDSGLWHGRNVVHKDRLYLARHPQGTCQ